MSYQEILDEMGLSDQDLTKDEFESIRNLAGRKAELNGKDEVYIKLLLPHLIMERIYNRFLMNAAMVKE